MNPQEIFNKVWEHAQKKEIARDAEGNCSYRTDDGKRCFIGCLIPDDKYTPVIENITPSNIVPTDTDDKDIDVVRRRNKFRQILNDIGIETDPRTLGLLQYLQRAHDGNEPHAWNRVLTDIAKTYELTVPTI